MARRELPKHVYPVTSKAGRTYLYFRRKGESHRLPDLNDPQFWAEYALLVDGRRSQPTKKTLARLCDSYRRSHRFTKLAKRTKQDYDKVLDYICDAMGDLSAVKIQRKDIIRAQRANADATRFANYIVQVFKVVLEHAHDEGWRTDNPAKGIPLLKTPKERKLNRRPWPREKVEAFRGVATGRTLLLFELLLGTGQRIGDVLAMRWGDVDDGGVWVSQGKTDKRLFVPFTARLRDALQGVDKPAVWILTNERGTGPWSYRGAAQAVRKVREQVGALDYDIHALRCTAAAEIAALGLSDDDIMSLTGHDSKAMVRLYAGEVRQITRARKVQEKRT